MAKSTRSKVKRSFRAKKREEGVYAATEAARLNRLNAKLTTTMKADRDGDVPLEGDAVEEGIQGDEVPIVKPTEGMDVDGGAQSQKTKISTHGPRNSRNEEWRISKNMAPRGKSRGMNRQGSVAARRKAGRASRRR
ncbi:hypothetical protein CONPUDRAFT_103177 [Coniophora puteana RWD-64-598 SS2]|uniref:DUF2423 domain-containing protein n=1 Tax=Coniophora puteana (strain RWD-64-598) TaxID=741705 RepID=A0A5M3MU58_CONPW|nr:uncharacterized protein CONPUDRAFT_103177 [Coniophora puteana RWD-64-598 SS2]EIW82245.1 hypothetical protein CONPUDRAFT_103177 [Coniophora puteana RWD-64-598 SS2]